MKINKEAVSAFAVYSEKFRQKNKSKPVVTNGVNKPKLKNDQNTELKKRQIKEIEEILNSLTEKSNINKSGITSNPSKTNKSAVSNLLSNKKTTKKVRPASESETLSDLCSKTLNNQGKTVGNIKKAKNNTDRMLKTVKSGNVGNRSRDKNNSVTKYKKNHRLVSEYNVTESKNIENLIVNATVESKNQIDSSSSNLAKSSNMEQRVNPKGKSLKRKKNKLEQKESKPNIKRKQAQGNSALEAKGLFKWLIRPITPEDFMSDYWEKKPLLIQREGNRDYFSELFSTPEIDFILRQNVIYFTKHLDVTSYTDGVRETHNLSGRAQANVVWDFYSNGCSIRLLNPQAFSQKIHTMNTTLQEYFGCFVGANIYLTPPNSQGFAPHYDDIEAFVLQIEGKKQWKVYHPRNEKETLPRFSSPNFSQDEIGEPILDVTLEAGDTLYFPRGFIHQASTVEGEHSLHITLSAYQKTAWVDLLEKALPLALKRAASEDVEFRRGLPRNYLGIEHLRSDKAKISFMDTAQKLMSKLNHFLSLSLGAGVDQMGAQFMHDALPPVFSAEEKQNSSFGGGLKMEKNGKLVNRVEFQLETKVKLIKSNVCRLVEEEEEVRLYHCLDNPLEYHAEEPQFLVLPPEGISVITFLFQKYPVFSPVKAIPHNDKEALLALVSDLWDAGLLMAEGLQTASMDD